MSMPKIPDLECMNLKREDAVSLVISSIAMEELALAHILNAEGEKLQYFLGTLEGKDPGEVTICDLLAVNKSVEKMVKNITKAEMILEYKLEDVLELDGEGIEIERFSIEGKKTWDDDDNAQGRRPCTLKVELFRDGRFYKAITIDANGNGVYKFNCLPVWKNKDEQYVYTIDEEHVRHYTKEIDGYNLINHIIR